MPILTEQFLKNNKEYICNNYNVDSGRCSKSAMLYFNNQCEHKCPRTCVEQLFKFTLDTYFSYLGKYTKVLIGIKHDNSPDHIIVHIPEMYFIEFISNLGGLLGMWLGMSALFTFDSLLNSI